MGNVGKHEWKTPFRNTGVHWGADIKIYVKGTGWDLFAQDRTI
jgi:hypothetical protein